MMQRKNAFQYLLQHFIFIFYHVFKFYIKSNIEKKSFYKNKIEKETFMYIGAGFKKLWGLFSVFL